MGISKEQVEKNERQCRRYFSFAAAEGLIAAAGVAMMLFAPQLTKPTTDYMVALAPPDEKAAVLKERQNYTANVESVGGVFTLLAGGAAVSMLFQGTLLRRQTRQQQQQNPSLAMK